MLGWLLAAGIAVLLYPVMGWVAVLLGPLLVFTLYAVVLEGWKPKGKNDRQQEDRPPE